MTKKIKLLYIAGMGRSGSTLLTNLISQIPGVEGVGELYALWDRGLIDHQLCGCSRPFPSCPFWSQVMDTAYSRESFPDPKEMDRVATEMRRIKRMFPLWSDGSFEGQVKSYISNVIPVYKAINRITGSAVIVEESKFPTYAFHLERARELDIYVLHLVRDSRAVAYSWQRKRRRPEYPDDNPWMYRYSIARSAYLWTMWNTLTELLGFNKRQPYLRIRYEDLVEQPLVTLHAILEFLDFPQGQLDLDRLLDLNQTVHSVWGNPMRFERPIIIRPDFEWRTAMPLTSSLFVGAFTWPLLYRYGYRI